MRNCGHSSAREQTVGHFNGFQIHVAVHAADHQIQLGEGVGREVERAIFHDVTLDAGEDADTERPLVQCAHMPRESYGARFIQAVGHGDGLRMIGDGDVFVTHVLRRLGHLLQRRPAIGFGGVHVDVAADVFELDQRGDAAFRGGLDFAGVFAQLGRNPGEAERLVNLLLRFRRPRAHRPLRGRGHTR